MTRDHVALFKWRVVLKHAKDPDTKAVALRAIARLERKLKPPHPKEA